MNRIENGIRHVPVQWRTERWSAPIEFRSGGRGMRRELAPARLRARRTRQAWAALECARMEQRSIR
jgi:hypothetical protein